MLSAALQRACLQGNLQFEVPVNLCVHGEHYTARFAVRQRSGTQAVIRSAAFVTQRYWMRALRSASKLGCRRILRTACSKALGTNGSLLAVALGSCGHAATLGIKDGVHVWRSSVDLTVGGLSQPAEVHNLTRGACQLAIYRRNSASPTPVN